MRETAPPAVLAILAIALLGLASGLPWWTVHGGLTADTEFRFYLDRWCVAAYPCDGYSLGRLGTMGDVLRGASLLIAAALGLSAGHLVLLAVRGKWPRLGRWSPALGVGSFLLALGAGASVYVALPGAATADQALYPGAIPVNGFYGSSVRTIGMFTYSYTYGGDWGWYLTLTAGILLLISSFFAVRRSRRANAAN